MSTPPQTTTTTTQDDEFTVIYVPGRVCLFGDKIDLKGLPIIAATVDKTLKLSIRRLPGESVKLQSDSFPASVEFTLSTVSDRSGAWWNHPLKYWAAVVQRLLATATTASKLGGFEARLSSNIPMGKGMASSGAVSVALLRGLNAIYALGLEMTDIAALAYLAEHDDLGIPCGRMDQYAIAAGGMTHIWTGENPVVTRIHIPPQCHALSVVVGDTLEPRPLQALLKKFREKLAEKDPLTEDVFERIAQNVERGKEALESGDLERVGECMREQMAQERRIGCISPGLERLCAAAEKAGAYGAKLTGVGGGGCMVALCREGREEDVAKAIVDVGGKSWIVKVVYYENEDGMKIKDFTPAF